MRAVRVHEFGEAGVLGLEEIPPLILGPGKCGYALGLSG